MPEIICKHCGSISEKRKGSQFCSVKCKNAYWNKRRNGNIKVEDNNQKETIPLHNNTEKVPPKTIIKTFMIENPEYTSLKNQIFELDSSKSLKIKEIQKLKRQIETLLKTDNTAFTVTGAALGGYGGNLFNTEESKFGLIAGAFLGAIGGSIYGNYLKSQIPNEHKKLVQKINSHISELRQLDQQIRLLRSSLIMLPEKIEQKKEIANPDFLLFKENLLKEQKHIEQKKKEIEDQKRKEKEEKTQIIQKLENPKTEIELADNPKRIISYKEFTQFIFETLDFQGKWNDFIGQPAVNFYMVIHGRAGSGKTTFNIQFAIYLSVKFGDVLYISGEEGFSKTLQQKLEKQKDLIENLYFADLHSLEDIFVEVPENTYEFIFIDSLNNMKIDAEGLQQLREKHPGAATIAIAQSTKDGKMRGSNEIIHDCDIEISVDEGVAKTIKNRYKETGLTYKIF